MICVRMCEESSRGKKKGRGPSRAEPADGNEQAHNRVARRDTFLRLWAYREQLLGLTLLLPLFALIYYQSYCLRFDEETADWTPRFWSSVAWVAAIKLAVFGWFRVAQGWRRSVTFYDLMALARAATCGLLLVALANRFLFTSLVIPRSIYLLDWGITIVILGGTRSLVRGFRELNWRHFFACDQVPVFLVGAGETGELVLRAVLANRKPVYRVTGLIDDDPRRRGARVAGVPVIGGLDDVCELARRHGVQQVLVVQDELPGQRLRQLVDDARPNGIEVRVLPSYQRLIEGSVTIQPRPVAIDDLLHRDPVNLDLENIRRWIDGRVLLITGSAGSIGSEICRQLLRFSPRRLILVDRSENGQFFLERELRPLAGRIELVVVIADVLDEERIRALLEEHRPDVIFHAAAYKHVPLMEAHPGEAVKNIVVATRRLADAAVDCGVKSFVMISTDKAVNPTSVMGTCKRIAELYVQSLAEHAACRFITVRFGNVLDSAGSVVPVFRQQIARGGPVTVTHPDMLRFFMTIPEAAQLVIQAGTVGNGGEILTLDMGDPVRIVDLAADMIRLSGFRVGEDIDIEFVGLRPGEKLVEELLGAGEKRLPTRHPKIAVADHRPCSHLVIRAAANELETLADGPRERVLAALQRIVPEYRRQAAPAAEQRAA